MKFRNGIFGLTLTSALALGAFSANAADMYRAPQGVGGYKDGPVYVANTWTGFYAGVNGGYGWTSDSSSLPGVDFQPEGGFGGGQIGYNWQGGLGLGGAWVFGVEADFQGADISDSAFGVTSKLNWFGTVRGRLGYAFDRTLVYATGGFAYGEVEKKIPGFSQSETQTGYVVGGGVEYKINPSWSLKGEYQFISLDASDFNGVGPVAAFSNTDSTDVHTVRLGLNYHVGHGYEPLK
jgi:outer membrane immunogenic protein